MFSRLFLPGAADLRFLIRAIISAMNKSNNPTELILLLITLESFIKCD